MRESKIYFLLKSGIFILLFGVSATNASAQKTNITGMVVDETGGAVTGVSVVVSRTTNGVITDAEGAFQLSNVSESDTLVVSFIGMESQRIPVHKKRNFLIIMKEQASELDEVVVVAFAKQKKESLVSSISTIRPAELKVSSSNLTTAMAGRIAGMISYQRTGEPGRDNAEFFIRGVTTFGYKKDPLILIDNVELTAEDLARLQTDDIASFSIMKDASATALYGARGANGVILVTTKEGRDGPAKLNVRLENSFSSPTMMVKTADPVTYMKLHNEAILTRDPLGIRMYSNEKIAMTETGKYPNFYPAIDWHDALFKDYASNQRANLNLSGGGKFVRYYIAATYAKDNGVLKVDQKNNYNNNINLQQVQLRSNINIAVTKTTNVNIKMNTSFDEYSGPIWNGNDVFKMAMSANPVLFPAYYEPNEDYARTQHILFGSYRGEELNPYAEMVRGYRTYSKGNLNAQIEFEQDLSFITPGLNFRALGSTNRYSYFEMFRKSRPFYYTMSYFDSATGRYGLSNLNPSEGTEYLMFDPKEGAKDVNTAFYFEGAFNYSKTIAEKHFVSGLLVGTMREATYSNVESLELSLPYRNIGLAGRFTYTYDSRYFSEINFGYNGSERFSSNERMGFFPSFGLGWMVSNEAFWSESLSKTLNKLKLKGTYGWAGNDAIGDPKDRFYYMSNVTLDPNQPYIKFNRYANDQITWETSQKMNLGIEFGLFKNIEIQADYFTEYRSNILQNRNSIPSTMGLQQSLKANVGEASSKGFEVSIDANHSFNKDFWLQFRGNFTYAVGKYEVFEEPDYPYEWRSWVGLPVTQRTGLIAERLFIDEADIANSPLQTFGDYKPGDIKYMDIDGNGKIDVDDNVPIGHPTTPNIIYGFGFSTGYKGIDFSVFFQGSAQSSFFIDPIHSAPFINMNAGYRRSNNALLQSWVDSHWSESNRDIYALWPRLSAELVDNNTGTNKDAPRMSTWFLRDGSFLRLKSAELGYTFPEKWVEKVKMNSARFYLSGLNLFLFSKFDLWDVEMGSNGLGYPVQRVVNIGLTVNF